MTAIEPAAVEADCPICNAPAGMRRRGRVIGIDRPPHVERIIAAARSGAPNYDRIGETS